MQITGSEPVSATAPSHDDDTLAPEPSEPKRGRSRDLPTDLPPGLVDALLRAPDVEPDRLDRARAWLRQHHADDDEPTPDELAGCILADSGAP